MVLAAGGTSPGNIMRSIFLLVRLSLSIRGGMVIRAYNQT